MPPALARLDPPADAPPRRAPSAPPPLLKADPPPAAGGPHSRGYVQRELAARLAVVRQSPGEWFRVWEWQYCNGPSLFASGNPELFAGFERTTRTEGASANRVYALYVRYTPAEA